jgi:seryl-tRNA synthetase
MGINVDKYLIKGAVQYLNDYFSMMNQHIDALEDSNSDAYKSVSKQVQTGDNKVADEDIKAQVESIRTNIMNSSINLGEIIKDLENSVSDVPVNKDDSVPDDDSDSDDIVEDSEADYISDVEVEEVG